MKIFYAIVLISCCGYFTARGQSMVTQLQQSGRPESYYARTLETDFSTGNYPNCSVLATAPVLADVDELGYLSHGISYREVQPFDMMECTEISRQGESWQRIKNTTSLIRPKYKTMAGKLALSNQEAEAFFPIYARYEAEANELYLSVSDNERLIQLQQQLRDKYYDELNERSSSYLASRFLDWENYYSTTCQIN